MSTSASRRALLCGIATVPALSVGAAASSSPSDLARACIEAIALRMPVENGAWMRAHTEEEAKARLDQVDIIINRAIKTPSGSFADLQAKARLGLDDMVLFGDDDESPGLRLVASVLREIIAMGGLA